MPHQVEMGSLVWIGISRQVQVGQPPKSITVWVQMGYLNVARPDATAPIRSVYMESSWGPDEIEDREIALPGGKPWPPPAGPHGYLVWRQSKLFPWWYEFDGRKIHEFSHPYWTEKTGDEFQITGELVNLQDTLVGTDSNPCIIKDIWVFENFALPNPLHAVDDDRFWGPNTQTTRDNFGIELLGLNKFKVWDKIVP